MSGLELDHIVIAADTLEAGADYIRERLGVAIPPGGKHPLMGTHNCLMRLGGSAFLEVIAIDPQAPAPARPRWYGLDDAGLRNALRASPRLVAWVLRSSAILRDANTAKYHADEVIPVSRGTLSWRLTVPADGRLPWGGVYPHLIEWDDGVRPWEAMADFGCSLERLILTHPEAAALEAALDRLGVGANGIISVRKAETASISALLSVDGHRVEIV